MSSYKPISYRNDTSNLERGYDDTPRSGHDHRERLTPRDLADELARSMARRLDAAARTLGLSRKNFDSVELREVIGSKEDTQFNGSADDLLEMEALSAAKLKTQTPDFGGAKQESMDSGFSEPSEAQTQTRGPQGNEEFTGSASDLLAMQELPIETLDAYVADAGGVATETASEGQAKQLSEAAARDKVQKALQSIGYGGSAN